MECESRAETKTSDDYPGFETLISHISARLILSSLDQIDSEIERSMESIRTFFRADRFGLLRVQKDRNLCFVTHAAYAEGYEPVSRDVNLAALFPRLYEELLSGKVSLISRVGDEPPSLDRDSHLKMGVRSVLDIPIRIGGGVRYIFTLNYNADELEIPEAYVPRLRLLGEMFANALERKRWDLLIRESEERTRMAAEAAGAGLWSLDLATGRIWIADATREVFGFPPDAEFTFDEFLRVVHAEDIERVRLVLKEVRESGKKGEVEYRILHPGGEIRWIKSAGSLVHSMAGERVMGFSIDITGRRQAESMLRGNLERMAAAVDVARLGFYEAVWDKQQIILEDGIRNLLDLPPEEEPRALDYWFEHVHPDDREKVLASREALREKGKQFLTMEYRYLHPEKGELWFLHSIRMLERDREGRGVRSIGVIHDVTDQKRVEVELRRSLEEVRRLRDEFQQQNIILRAKIDQEIGQGAIVGESEPILKALAAARRVAPTDTSVLITGETGTGKELIAEAIHQMSRRAGRLMVRVNCAALPPSLIESELFGREKGAYTGAMTHQIGRFEQANGSTLFLDEIAELPLDMQPKLLRVLQDGTLERLGSRSTQKVDVRVIAATNRDLSSLVREGRFRADLFFRLSVFPIEAPALRDRSDDIPLLVWTFVRQFAKKMGKSIDTIPRQTMERLRHHPWPGNVRELRNLIERSVILSDTRVLTVDFPSAAASEAGAATTLEEAERRHILQALQRCGWRIRGPRGAAEQLGVNPTTLHSKIKKLGISRPTA